MTWTPCQCGEYWCTIHGRHAFGCDCPPVEDYPGNPYDDTTEDDMNYIAHDTNLIWGIGDTEESCKADAYACARKAEIEPDDMDQIEISPCTPALAAAVDIYGGDTPWDEAEGVAMTLGEHASIEELPHGDRDAVANLMDNALREAVHADLAPCEWVVFLVEYCARHLAKHGADFEVA